MSPPDAPSNNRRKEHIRNSTCVCKMQPQGENVEEEARSWVIIDRESTQVIDRCDTLFVAEERAERHRIDSGKELVIEKR